MSDDRTANTTLSTAGIGVWEGARVIYTPTAGYQGSLRRPGERGVVSEVVRRGDASWALVAFGEDVEAHPLVCLALDLTHRPTRLEVMARLAERLYPQDAPIMSAAVMPGWAAWPDRLVYGISVVSLLSGEAWHSLDERAPALATLDPADDTRLPDGTRLVDVRALAIVAAQAFGCQP